MNRPKSGTAKNLTPRDNAIALPFGEALDRLLAAKPRTAAKPAKKKSAQKKRAGKK